MDDIDAITEGLTELAWEQLTRGLDRGERQVAAREAVVDTINRLCDSLQLGGDLIATQISRTIVEYSALDKASIEAYEGFFQRLTTALAEPNLRLALHQGGVCGELHTVGDRFRQPLNWTTASGLPIGEWISTFFRRSNSMSQALDGLLEGELNYLSDMAEMLDEARNLAETALTIPIDTQDLSGSTMQLRVAAENVLKLLRERRSKLRERLEGVRANGDAAIKRLH